MGNISADFRSDEDDVMVPLRKVLVDQLDELNEALRSNEEAMETFKQITKRDDVFESKFEATDYLEDLDPDDAAQVFEKLQAAVEA